MATKAFHIRVDAKQKKRLEELFERMGLDVPTAVRIFFKRVEITGEIPFLIGANQEIDNYSPRQLAYFDKLAKEAMEGKNIAASFKMPEDREKMSQWLRHG
jgi:DNA-damage-inducible protein J